jgi:hypothetical protein
MKKSWIIGGAVVLVAVFAWLLFGGLEKKRRVLSHDRRRLLAKGRDGVGVPVRLGGQVKPGSDDMGRKESRSSLHRHRRRERDSRALDWSSAADVP